MTSFRNICVFGAGALGGAVAAKVLAASKGETEISVVARGAHLDGIRTNGLRVWEAEADKPITVRPRAVGKASELPKQDLVITGLKGHQLSEAASDLAGLLGDHTRIVMILNGIPWWYFHRDRDSRFAERQLPELDPDGTLWRLLGPERIIGCVAYQGAEVIHPGEIRLSNKGRFILGEPSGEATSDLKAISDLLSASGINITTSHRVRDDIWSKLMGNAAFNPISALTRALMTDIMGDPALSEMVARVMSEVKAVGESLGARFSVSVESRLEQSRHVGAVRTSMLQDLLAGKALEITPLVGMVVSLGKLTGVATPASETILALVSQLDKENRRAG